MTVKNVGGNFAFQNSPMGLFPESGLVRRLEYSNLAHLLDAASGESEHIGCGISPDVIVARNARCVCAHDLRFPA